MLLKGWQQLLLRHSFASAMVAVASAAANIDAP